MSEVNKAEDADVENNCIQIGSGAFYKGDCRLVMAALRASSHSQLYDAIISDPPYEVGIFGKSWDNSGVAFDKDVWSNALAVTKPGGRLAAFGARRTYHRLACAIEDAGWIVEDQLFWAYGQGMGKTGKLKAAHEPIVLARKPTLDKQLVPHLNVDATRVPWPDGQVPQIGTPGWGGPKKKLSFTPGGNGKTVERSGPNTAGRWPSTIIHDGSVAVEDSLSGKSGYFFCAKADHRDKVGDHETQKPILLMRWLVRLLSNSGDHVLDPFCGSGTTLEAALLEGRKATGIELTEQYWGAIETRLKRSP